LTEAAIREARRASNEAIARRDAAAIASLLMPAYHVVTARGAQRQGRDESRRNWEAMFAADSALRYERIPIEVRVHEELGVAHETGEWTGTAAGEQLRGVYSARWQRVEGAWRIEAEIFVPLP
jgi:uncharacterized protein (TIGR02246 family)